MEGSQIISTNYTCPEIEKVDTFLDPYPTFGDPEAGSDNLSAEVGVEDIKEAFRSHKLKLKNKAEIRDENLQAIKAE